MITEAKLTIAGLRARAVNVKLERPVQTSSGEIPTAPLVLMDLETREGTSHIFPEISAHLLAASPTSHRLEYLDLAAPILKESVRIEDGHALVPERPGIDLEWDEEMVSRLLVR